MGQVKMIWKIYEENNFQYTVWYPTLCFLWLFLSIKVTYFAEKIPFKIGIQVIIKKNKK